MAIKTGVVYTLGTHLSLIPSVGRSASLENVLWQNGWLNLYAVWVVSGVGQGMYVLHGVVIVKGEGVVLGVNVGHPIVTNGDFDP